MNDKSGKDLEGNGHSLINAKTWHLLGVRKTIKMSIRIACIPAEIQTEQLLSTVYSITATPI